MGLTFNGEPLSGRPSPDVNYTLDGPKHKIYFHPFPRRVRIEVAGHQVVDTTGGMLLHETGLLPVFYAPESDIDDSLFEPSEHTSHCPFKGDASYRHFVAGEEREEDLFWSYPDPIPGADYLRGYWAPYVHRVDWWDEDERIHTHLRDPFTRVDVRRSSRRVRILSGATVVAETTRPVILSETGLPNRHYIPREDVLAELIPSEKKTHCPYKGHAGYESLRLADGEVVEDAAWFYPDPYDGVQAIKDLVCFAADHLTTELDGEVIAQ